MKDDREAMGAIHDPNSELFVYDDAVYDISTLKRVALPMKDKAEEKARQKHVKYLEANVGHLLWQVLDKKVAVDPSRVAAMLSLGLQAEMPPILLVTRLDGGRLLVDGWTRVVAACSRPDLLAQYRQGKTPEVWLPAIQFSRYVSKMVEYRR